MTTGRNLVGWQFWRIENQRLVAPFTGVQLRDDGRSDSLQRTDNEIPHLGVSFFETRRDVLRAAAILDAPDIAITEGIVTSPITFDAQDPVYDIDEPSGLSMWSFRGVVDAVVIKSRGSLRISQSMGTALR